jgi:hypothetical protein
MLADRGAAQPGHSSGKRAAQRAGRWVQRVEATWERRDGAAIAQRDVLVLAVQLGGVNRLWFLATPSSPEIPAGFLSHGAPSDRGMSDTREMCW